MPYTFLVTSHGAEEYSRVQPNDAFSCFEISVELVGTLQGLVFLFFYYALASTSTAVLENSSHHHARDAVPHVVVSAPLHMHEGQCLCLRGMIRHCSGVGVRL
jgi:hypothetical protein